MKPPRIQWLPAFAAAGRHKSFRKAATALHVSPPAISQQIKALEDHLGIELFTRHGPRLELTEAGRHYWPKVQQLVDRYQRDFEEFDRRFNQRSFRLNAPLFIAQEVLIPHYLGYQKYAPSTELRLTTGTEYIDFETDSTDAAIRVGGGNWPTLNAQLLCPLEVTAVCSPTYYQRYIANRPTAQQPLDDQVIISMHESLDDWRLLYPELQPRETVICDSYFSVIKTAEQGIGIGLGLVPAINSWLNDQRLQMIDGVVHDSNSAYWLVSPKQRDNSALVAACFDWAKALFDDLPELTPH